MKIITIGSIALDTIETPEAREENVWGGSAVYFSFAASNFASSGIVGIAGGDFPAGCLDMLKERGVDLEGLEIAEGKTFRWEGRYLENMNDRETLSVCPNVFEGYEPVLPEKYKSAEYVFLGNISPSQQLKVLSQVENPVFTAADTMDLWINNERENLLKLLEKVDMLILNDSEAKLLTGEDNLLKAARSVSALGPGHVIIKRGENGALLTIEGEVMLNLPAYPLASFRDPTGAGDAFGGGVLGYIAGEGNIDDETLRRAVAYGTVIASFCVEEFSLNKLKAISRKDIDERFESFSRMTRF